MTRLLQTLRHTPPWVFALFFVLLALGVRQLRPRQVSPMRLAVMPLVTGAFSVYGVVSTFGLNLLPSFAWATGAALATCAVLMRPPGLVRYEAATRTIHMPGSAAPLASMMGIFITKYALTVVLVLQSSLRQRGALAVSTLVESRLNGSSLSQMLRHGLTTTAFCLLIAAALTVTGAGSFGSHLAYALPNGLIAWLIMDTGRQLFSRATLWPHGPRDSR